MGANQTAANDMAALQAAILTLGHCFVQPSGRDTYVLHGINGALHVCALEDGGIVCLTDEGSMADEHTSIVTLYRLRWEGIPVRTSRGP